MTIGILTLSASLFSWNQQMCNQFTIISIMHVNTNRGILKVGHGLMWIAEIWWMTKRRIICND